MNNKVIEVLDYIGEKIGIAVDWTSDNVWPQVVDILGRYRILQIVFNCLWLVIMCGVLIVLAVLWKTSIKARKTCIDNRESNCWWNYRSYSDRAEMNGTFSLIIGSVFAGVFSIVFIPGIISNILKWVLVPEMKFFEVFSDYLQNLG